MTKITYIEKVRRENASIHTQVMNLLGWDELKYAEYQENVGREYLYNQFGEGSTLVDDIPNHKVFWSWWKLHWIRREREFLEMAGMLFAHELEEYYRELHHPDGVHFRPHADVLQATYEEMIHRLVKEVTK
jgi:hypothetical protein